MFIRSIAFLLIFLLAACATGRSQDIAETPWKLPESQPREVVQILNGNYGDQPFALQIRLSLTEEKLLLVGLDSLGRRAFDILWDETGVRAGKAEWISADLDAADILKVIVATYWPEDDPMQEKVADRAEELDITYQGSRENAWNETVQIRDPANDYDMTIISYELTE